MMLFKRNTNMATGKNTKGKANGGGSRAHARYSGLMALESRVLFSAAALVSDVPEPVNDAAAAIEASLVPGESHSIINPQFKGRGDGQRIGISPIPGGGSVMVVNPNSVRPADNPEGSNPTPHPMPVPEFSDIELEIYNGFFTQAGSSAELTSGRSLEHGPGLHNSVPDSVRIINPDLMRPADAQRFTGSATDPGTAGIWTDGTMSGIWTDGTMTNLQPQIGSEHFPPPGLCDSILDSVEVVDSDSMRPASNRFRGCIPTDPCQMSPQGVSRGQMIGKTVSRDADSFFDVFTELSLVGDEPRDLSPAT
jgi:hypothetical protein